MKRKVDGSRSHGAARPRREARPGGIREVEFIVQAQQLVHGGQDQRLRSRATLTTLRALADVGLLDRGESASLSEAYRFLRDVEHKLQIVHERQTQVIPQDAGGGAALARRLGYHLGRRRAPPRAVERRRRSTASAPISRRHRAAVRRSFELLFFGARSEIRREAEEDVVALLETLERDTGGGSSARRARLRGPAEPPWRTCFGCATGRRTRRHPRGARRRCSRWHPRCSRRSHGVGSRPALLHMAS